MDKQKRNERGEVFGEQVVVKDSDCNDCGWNIGPECGLSVYKKSLLPCAWMSKEEVAEVKEKDRLENKSW